MDAFLERLLFPQWRYALVAVLIIAGVGYFYLGRGPNLGATLTVSQGDFVEQVRVSGTVTAAQDVALGFATNGRIAGVYAEVGQRVLAGTVLAETENGDLIATLAQKQAALAQAEANLAALVAGTRPEELASASLAVVNAKASLSNAIQNVYTASDDAVRNRVDLFFTNPRTNPKLSFVVANVALQNLVESDRTSIETGLVAWALIVANLSNDTAAAAAIQSQKYVAQVTTLLADANRALNQGVPDQAISIATLASYSTTLATARTNVNTSATALTTAAAALDTAQSALTLKQAGSTSDAIAAQEAAVAAAAAEVRSARAKVVATRIVAPFSGIVTRMDAKVGEIIAPTTSEISLQSNGIFEIETYVPEVAIAHIAPGNLATTTLDAYGAAVTFPATVIAVDPAETIRDGVPTYKTTLAFTKADSMIRSGMTANVTIVTGVLHDAIVIPSGAVGMQDGASFVSVIERGTASSHPVSVGPSPALGQAYILSGLSAGEVILLSPAH
ncbi:MAG: efflux RND transporter periplasmic adaptor subunit [Candidatus Kaiserbacteria bacterium]|nr:efflux RND transporter periplasmic adaptor subunit [Candidatus Kaiserbacteria bacterium]